MTRCRSENQLGTSGAEDEADALFFCAEATKMFDLLFVAVTIAFFAITLAYTTGCERL